MNYSKDDAIRIVTKYSEVYDKELNGRNLLFLCMDKHKAVSYIEFAFHDYNFMHLTGLKPACDGLKATDFYRRCLGHKLSPDDFAFAPDGTTPMKLDVLPLVICRNLSANMVGDFNSPHPKLYTEKAAGSTKAYIGFVKDVLTSEYVPNTVVKEDMRMSVTDYKRVIAVYRKKRGEEKYAERVYLSGKIDWSRIQYPKVYSYLPKPEG
ncbi:MAG: PBECR4 domain-containing protein [Lachnospiraceae bacterium]|nr:PBECR4 domain-containing protein [Lachnospiraceae bacterium]